MKIVSSLLKFKLLYENRHLYTDDVHYNSLVISNIINQNIKLLDIEEYYMLNYDYKLQLYNTTPYVNYILNKNGLYHIEQRTLNSKTISKNMIVNWEANILRLSEYIDIYTVVD